MGVVELRKTLQVACSSKEGRHAPAARSRFPGLCARLYPALQSGEVRKTAPQVADVGERVDACRDASTGRRDTSREYRTNGRKLRRALVRDGYPRSDERIRPRPDGGGDR